MKFYLLALALAMSAASCRTKDGTPGPAGESSLTQQGSITGNLAYINYRGDSINVPFSYGYFETLEENMFLFDSTKGYQNCRIELKRRDLKDTKNYLSFAGMYGYFNNPNNPTGSPTSGNFDFSLVKIINGQLFMFGAKFSSSVNSNSSSYRITNYNLDVNTGRLTYDYKIDFNPNDITNPYNYVTHGVINGHVDVILDRSFIKRNVS